MTGFGIYFETQRGAGKGRTDFRLYEHRLEGIVRRTDDMTPAFKKIRTSFWAGERQVFASAGQGAWRPNLPATTRRKAKHGQDARVMRAKGDLYRALGLGQGPTAVNELNAWTLTLGVNDPAAGVAQRSPNDARRRRLVQLSKQRRARWVAILADHVTGGGRP